MSADSLSKNGRAALSSGLVFLFLAGGCSAPDVNPSKPAVHKGYVDFYCAATDALQLEVKRFDAGSRQFTTVFSELTPLGDGILRLAAAPGPYRVQVNVLNRLTEGPAECRLVVAEGMVTPVRLELSESGLSQVKRKEARLRAIAAGGVGVGVKVTSDETVLYHLALIPQAAQPYRLKTEMGYR